jgi:hypothetical protein
LGYVFTELYPVAIFAKLQLARTTPFAQLMLLTGISVVIEENYRKKNLLVCILILIALAIPHGSYILFIIGALLSTIRVPNRYSRNAYFALLALISIGVLIFISQSGFQGGRELWDLSWKILLFLVVMVPFCWQEYLRTSQKVASSIVLSSISFIFFLLAITDLLPSKIDKIKLNSPSKSDLAKLAVRFRSNSSETALTLTPPKQHGFRFYSQRSTVFDFKSFPYTNTGIKEWKWRMESILGSTSRATLVNGDQLYCDLNESDLLEIARQFRAGYVLTKKSCHPEINAEVFDSEGDWIIYHLEEQ